MSSIHEIRIERAVLAQIIDLRHRILRAGLPRETAIFAGDDAETARHYAAWQQGAVVGCATFHLNSFENEPAWQLRGMASEQGMQRKGIGAALLRFAENELRTSSTLLLWCNARVPAVGFYLKQGWAVVSEEFDIPTAGPHVRMRKRLP